MTSITYTITEAKAQLSDIIRRVKRGDLITIGAHRVPEIALAVCKSARKRARKKRVFGKLRGKIWIAPDLD